MSASRRKFIKNLSLAGAFPFLDTGFLRSVKAGALGGDEREYGPLIQAPEDPASWPAFRAELHQWRSQKKQQLGYTGSTYDDPAYHWASVNFSCCFLMMCDLDFYDPVKGEYTVDRIIDRGKKEFGGYDSIVLWHAYPRIGIDERNQFDFYRDMPGGLAGLRKLTGIFRKEGIRVFINYNPWDTGTRREPKPDIDALVDMVEAMGVDGIFLDTMKKAGANFREKLDQVKPGIVLEGELAAELEILPSHHLSWAQEFKDRVVPGVLRNKWFERRHIQHQIARWNRDHSTELQQAWMNGSGMMVWENVFGQWIAWCERDKSILRTMLPIQRRYHRHFTGENWDPLVSTAQPGIFASRWSANNVELWTLVNRNDQEISGPLISLPHYPAGGYYDLVAGTQARRRTVDGAVVVEGTIGPRSIGCFIAGKVSDLGNGFSEFLSAMQESRKGYRNETGFSPMSPVPRRVPARALRASFDAGMRELGPVTINQRYMFIIRECGTYASYPLFSLQPLGNPVSFDRKVHVPHLAVDITPVTNRQYFEFIKATGYQPREKANFLKHWDNGFPPAGKEDHPVVYVDLNDARAYARWRGKRLPTEGEWQFAAQGYEQNLYPWGNELKEGCYNNGNGTTAVDAFPAGQSPTGCLDMCGNTWEMTESEHADTHNRFCILKGGSYFEAKGSIWYTGGGPQPSQISTKFLMLYPGLDRCSTVGFRCVMDLK
jgi:hypothetical protein